MWGSLPVGFLRTGIRPRRSHGLTISDCSALINYLWTVAASATTHSAQVYRGEPDPAPYVVNQHLVDESLVHPFRCPLPPMRPPAGFRPKRTTTCRNTNLWMPIFAFGATPLRPAFRPHAVVGESMLEPDGAQVCACGPVTPLADIAPGRWISCMSNNVAELAALHFALRYVRQQPAGMKVAIVFDFAYHARALVCQISLTLGAPYCISYCTCRKPRTGVLAVGQGTRRRLRQ